MKKFAFTFVLVFGLIFTMNSQFQDVDDMNAYCEDFALRGAEMEFADGRKDYFTAYYEWYWLCEEAHGLR